MEGLAHAVLDKKSNLPVRGVYVIAPLPAPQPAWAEVVSLAAQSI